MSTDANVVIRDGLVRDITKCLQLDNSYQTEYVWQMHIHEEDGQVDIQFKTERLPRMLEVTPPNSEAQLRQSLPREQCFLVAHNQNHREPLGYLAMRNSPAYQTAFIHTLVVSRPYRRRYIGTRLLNIARQWAQEHDLLRITIETQTKNHPGILFCRRTGFGFSGFNDQYFPNHDIAVFFSQALR